MFINELQLKNYRNYENLNISFTNKVNVIIGENAQGKTNLLESIYVLAFTKSYRSFNDKKLILWQKEFAKISGTIHKKNQNIPLEIIFHQNGKKAKKNRIEQKKLSDYLGIMNVVMFAPEDLALVKGSPQIRRRFINMELGQIAPTYIFHLGQYQTILKQRNHLLKQIQQQKTNDHLMLNILTEQLAQHAAILIKKRFEFLHLLKKWAIPLHEEISRHMEKLDIDYLSSVKVLEDDEEEKLEHKYLESFKEIESNEIRRGTTLIGPHRDDLMFKINDKDVRLFGSQGQQRTTALSLKLAEIDLIYNETGHYPILLLDDVLSELDDYRQSHLLNTIQGKIQTFVSTTTVDGIDHDTIGKASLYEVMKGNVKQITEKG